MSEVFPLFSLKGLYFEERYRQNYMIHRLMHVEEVVAVAISVFQKRMEPAPTVRKVRLDLDEQLLDASPAEV
ncbi:hypothetical protein G6M14_05585 [Agrobacterium tumefaciens]|uniref:hypothetical protein n=1 Tax=Agrobacterium tumefaciens TaxID=358 RepID=UPI0015746283|nr:hypothetical protein [Agrobacterium tumefaciens]